MAEIVARFVVDEKGKARIEVSKMSFAALMEKGLIEPHPGEEIIWRFGDIPVVFKDAKNG